MKDRYLRQLIIPEFGLKSQKCLLKSRVAVIGAGGIGSSAIAYLAAAGIRSILIADKDLLDETNLNRQIIYKEKDIGKKKVDLAEEFINGLDYKIKVSKLYKKVDVESIKEILSDFDILLDCSDNFDTRFAINEAAYYMNKPYIFSAVYRFEGQIALLNPSKGPCLNCFIKDYDKNLTCADYGILGPVAGIMGCLSALKAINYLTGISREMDKLFMFNFKDMTLDFINLKKDKKCLVCSKKYLSSCLTHKSILSVKKMLINLSSSKIKLKDNKIKVINLNLEDLESYLPNIDKNTEIILYCQKGIKSKIALSKLKYLGYKKARRILKIKEV
jgi:adenylyltransferase/sulfurtransferase